MSPNVGNFVHDLVEMAKAMETLPQVQAELNEVQQRTSLLHDQIDNIKADLEQSRNYAASLEQKVRSLEVERDDASFRVLETDETIQKFIVAMRNVEQSFGELVDGYDPKGSLTENYYQKRIIREGLSKPEPVKEPEPSATTAIGADNSPGANLSQGSSEPDPTATSLVEAAHGTGEQPAKGEVGATSSEEAPKSDANPPLTETSIGQDTGDTASSVDPGPAVGELLKGPYEGKVYYDMPTYVSYNDWIAGGGTHNDYYGSPQFTKNSW